MIIDSKFSTEKELCTCDGDSKQLSETGGAVVGGRNGCQKRNKWPIEKFRFNEKFKGKFTAPVMGVKKGGLFTKFGNPKMKDANWEAYQMAYGIMIVYYNAKGVVNKVIISTKTTDDIDLCSTN